jgi:hypothetical protein
MRTGQVLSIDQATFCIFVAKSRPEVVREASVIPLENGIQVKGMGMAPISPPE